MSNYRTHAELQAAREKRVRAGTEFLGAIVAGLAFSLPFIIEILKELK